ncbi:MAG TPA: DUF3099 domain-containing protein [Micromonosporaceae bacterium]
MKRAPRRPVVITDAQQSPDDQLRRREIRYVIMMSFRALCLIAAAILVGTAAPMLWLWVPLCVAGMVLVPWLAVILANDRPPKKEHQLAYRLHHGDRDETGGPQALPPADPPKVIDAEQ